MIRLAMVTFRLVDIDEKNIILQPVISVILYFIYLSMFYALTESTGDYLRGTFLAGTLLATVLHVLVVVVPSFLYWVTLRSESTLLENFVRMLCACVVCFFFMFSSLPFTEWVLLLFVLLGIPVVNSTFTIHAGKVCSDSSSQSQKKENKETDEKSTPHSDPTIKPLSNLDLDDLVDDERNKSLSQERIEELLSAGGINAQAVDVVSSEFDTLGGVVRCDDLTRYDQIGPARNSKIRAVLTIWRELRHIGVSYSEIKTIIKNTDDLGNIFELNNVGGFANIISNETIDKIKSLHIKHVMDSPAYEPVKIEGQVINAGEKKMKINADCGNRGILVRFDQEIDIHRHDKVVVHCKHTEESGFVKAEEITRKRETTIVKEIYKATSRSISFEEFKQKVDARTEKMGENVDEEIAAALIAGEVEDDSSNKTEDATPEDSSDIAESSSLHRDVSKPDRVYIRDIKDKSNHSKDDYVSVAVEVVSLSDPNNIDNTKSQQGLLSDESGNIQFTVWGSANKEKLSVDGCYALKDVKINRFNGRWKVEVVENTNIEEISGIDTWEEKKQDLLLQNNNRCEDCGVKLVRGDSSNSECPEYRLCYDDSSSVYTPHGKPHLDHVTPRSNGGSDDRSNLQVLCSYCHGDRHRTSMGEVDDINDAVVDEWCVFECQVLDIIDADDDHHIKQEGIISDSSGSMRFGVWEESNISSLEPGVTYRLLDVKVEEFSNDEKIIKIYDNATVKEIDGAVNINTHQQERVSSSGAIDIPIRSIVYCCDNCMLQYDDDNLHKSLSRLETLYDDMVKYDLGSQAYTDIKNDTQNMINRIESLIENNLLSSSGDEQLEKELDLLTDRIEDLYLREIKTDEHHSHKKPKNKNNSTGNAEYNGESTSTTGCEVDVTGVVLGNDSEIIVDTGDGRLTVFPPEETDVDLGQEIRVRGKEVENGIKAQEVF